MDDNIDDEVDEDQLEADAAEAAERRHLEIMSVLQQKKKLPWQTRNEIDELIEEFLDTVKSNIHGMICSNKLENYRGLDSERDTEQEVEAAIRLFPKVLTTKDIIAWHDDNDEDGDYVEYLYPVQLLAFSHRGDPGSNHGESGSCRCNLKAVAFVPLVARLAIEFGLFEEEERGGLLCNDFNYENTINNLMRSDGIQLHNREHHETVDNTYLQVLIQLRKMGLFKKEDIQRYDLLCNDYYDFADKRFRFLIE